MKARGKKILVIAVVMAVLFSVLSVAMARGPARGGGGCGFLMGLDRGGPGFGGGPGWGAFMDIDLSDSQKDQAIKIMQAYQIDRIKSSGDLIKAEDGLREALEAETVNEQNIRKAYAKRSLIQENLLVSQAKTMAEMKKILTPEQTKMLEEREERSDRDSHRKGDGRYSDGKMSGDCPRW